MLAYLLVKHPQIIDYAFMMNLMMINLFLFSGDNLLAVEPKTLWPFQINSLF